MDKKKLKEAIKDWAGCTRESFNWSPGDQDQLAEILAMIDAQGKQPELEGYLHDIERLREALGLAEDIVSEISSCEDGGDLKYIMQDAEDYFTNKKALSVSDNAESDPQDNSGSDSRKPSYQELRDFANLAYDYSTGEKPGPSYNDFQVGAYKIMIKTGRCGVAKTMSLSTPAPIKKDHNINTPDKSMISNDKEEGCD